MGMARLYSMTSGALSGKIWWLGVTGHLGPGIIWRCLSSHVSHYIMAIWLGGTSGGAADQNTYRWPLLAKRLRNDIYRWSLYVVMIQLWKWGSITPTKLCCLRFKGRGHRLFLSKRRVSKNFWACFCFKVAMKSKYHLNYHHRSLSIHIEDA